MPNSHPPLSRPVLGHRSLGQAAGALVEPRHYKAAIGMALRSTVFFDVLRRYLTGKGTYPYRCSVRTPLGIVAPTLYSYYDLLTLNEIFFREDYAAKGTERTVVDIGSNIGLSALYFLTRNREVRCILYEPDPRNIERLKENLASFTGRYVLNPVAVADQSGRLEFGLDVISGRYGGLGVATGHTTTVDCVHINTVLAQVLAQHERIDILKIDTEGSEVRTIQAIDAEFLSRIGRIYCEATPETDLHPDFFHRSESGTVTRLTNKGWR